MTLNIERMLDLLRDQDDDDDRLVKAEMLRELGRFDEALAELRFAFFTDGIAEASFKQQLESLWEKKSSDRKYTFAGVEATARSTWDSPMCIAPPASKRPKRDPF